MNHTDPTADVEERVARHLAAKDWLTTPEHWDNGSASFRADYLAQAREVIALVREADPAVSAVVSPPTSRADARKAAAEALREHWEVHANDADLADQFDCCADAVLAVLPEPTGQAAVLLDAADRMSRKAAKLTNGLDDLAIFVGKARAAEAEILNREADVLRRLAAEAQQQPDTETHAEEIGAALARYLVDRRLSEIQGAFRILGWPPLRFELVEDGEPASAVQQPAAADDEETPSRAVLLDLVRDFLDADPCSFDHHGYCQAHGWLGGEPGSCPHGRARKLIPGIDEDPIP